MVLFSYLIYWLIAHELHTQYKKSIFIVYLALISHPSILTSFDKNNKNHIKIYDVKFFSGPPRLPVLGAYLFLLVIDYKHLHKAIDRLCKYYKSNVLGFYYGPVPMIVANDIDSIKEVLTNVDLAGRPNLLLAQLREPNFNLKGIIAIESEQWQEQRRFILRNLRDFGFGRRFQELELHMKDEITSMINMIKNGPKYSHETVSYETSNVLKIRSLWYSL